MTLALVAGVAVALLADSPPEDQKEKSKSRVTSQTLGIYMLIGASSFALWCGMDYYRVASALHDQIPVRGRNLRIMSFSLFLATAVAGASVLPPRVRSSKKSS